MTNLKTPFKYDFVGSFLRPEKLKQARRDFFDSKISKEELTQIEDECIKDLISKQKELGYHVITDGEFRRSAWHLDFMWGFGGIKHTKTKNGLPFHDEAAMLDDTYLEGRLSYLGHHPFIDHFKYVKQFEDENTVAKLTIPAPAQFLEQLAMPFAIENTLKYYDNVEEVIEDLVVCYTSFINDCYNEGLRNLQFDDCSWGMLLDPKANLYFNTDLFGLEKIKKQFLDINNRVIENKPADLVINTHVCRGNYHSTYANEGPYDKVANTLFKYENVDAYYLEFDDERSGGFESLTQVSGNKKVVLGLITTKKKDLEDKDKIIKRIMEASKYIPLDRLSLSPQCGFASCEIGNKLSMEDEWNKLRLVKEIAMEVWK